ncbi:NAD(P)H-quinone oxidoreductase chain 4, chloroplastic [Frankliniella fusca]|uniref:NAD(P)H-quinone oxidoreductase chain 4, chloroplastic n=1 Tax=Frankliniella fusca TaxID=407009 RepID=A0AAE1GTI4_9NEOP|nr:NAD(P)H-quinone oxidoreductase chain 4, chloroplastic [Frankliniella fusca]
MGCLPPRRYLHTATHSSTVQVSHLTWQHHMKEHWQRRVWLARTSGWPPPRLLWSTSTAAWKRSLSAEPTTRKSGAARQHVRSSQDPDTPWHLHRTCMLVLTAWNTKRQVPVPCSYSPACMRAAPWGLPASPARPRGDSVEQFQRWLLNCCWHSLAAMRRPCNAVHVASGWRRHSACWSRLSPASVRHKSAPASPASSYASGDPGPGLQHTGQGRRVYTDFLREGTLGSTSIPLETAAWNEGKLRMFSPTRYAVYSVTVGLKNAEALTNNDPNLKFSSLNSWTKPVGTRSALDRLLVGSCRLQQVSPWYRLLVGSRSAPGRPLVGSRSAPGRILSDPGRLQQSRRDPSAAAASRRVRSTELKPP